MSGRGARGGRAAAILEAISRKPGSDGSGDSGASALEAKPPDAPKPVGRGRTSLIEALQRAAASSASEPTRPSLPVGRGRAQKLLELNLAKAESFAGSSATPHTSQESPIRQPSPPQESSPAKEPSPPQQRSPRQPCPPQPVPPQQTYPATAQPSASHSRKEEPPSRAMSHLTMEEKPTVKMSGSYGKAIKVTANYIRLFLEKGKGVYEYEVRFDPDISSRGLRINVVNQYMQELGGVKTFDGVTLYLPIKLKDERCTYIGVHPGDQSKITITVIFKRQRSMGECVHMYNVLFRRIMNVLELARIGRQHFYPKGSHKIPQHKLEVWPGFVTAVDEYEGGIQLCIDSSHRVLRTQTVLDLMQDLLERKRGAMSDYQREVHRLVGNNSVLTRYNNKVYRICDIAWNMNPASTFSMRNGTEVAFQDYYSEHYQLTVTDMGQPLLMSKVETRMRGLEPKEQLICLIPEFCYLTGLTDEMRSDFKVMKDIAEYTRITPNQRVAALKQFISSIQENAKARALLSDWGLTIDRDTVQMSGRNLDQETIVFRGDRKVVPQRADWGAAATQNPVLYGVNLVAWMVVHTNRDRQNASNFVSMMMKVAKPMGIEVNAPETYGLPDDRPDTYLRALRECINESLQLVVIIFPTARTDRYNVVKQLCCVSKPIPSQVINSRTISRPDKLRSIVQKIALQINCKLGGSLWTISIPMSRFMICGIDAYHDPSKRGKSVAAFVCSMDKSCSRWYSRVAYQGSNQEMMDALKMCFMSALQKFYEVNHQFPERIIVFRDGVGDGQLAVTRQHEVPQILSCFEHIGGSVKPSLTVIVCQKRINTRIFAQLNSELQNPGPGTVVDHTITRRTMYDYFLISQNVRQGTVSPTHYVVVHDNSNFTPDIVQRLTYKLCHLYYNWPGTVRVPAPCQYAHKLAQLVGLNLGKEPSAKLSDRLYFL